MVNQAILLQLVARDQNGNEFTADLDTLTWESSAPSVATVSESGAVRGLEAGFTEIEVTAGTWFATATIIVAEADTPEVETVSVTGVVEIPASVDSSAVWVYSGVDGAASVAADGSFVSESAVDQEGTLIAMNGDRPFGLVIQPPSDPAASPAAAVASAAGVTIDGRSTAVSLVFLTPLFASAPSGVTQELLDLISGLAEVDALEDAIRAGVEATGEMPDESDAAFLNAYRAAVQAGHDAMAARAGVSSQALVNILLVPDQARSGVNLDFPEGDATPSMTVMVQNVYGRDVDVYLTEADTAGNPRTDLSNLDSYKDDRVLQLPPADYVPDITSIAEWISLFRGNYGADDPTPLLLTFTPENPRYLLYAYGSGVSRLGSDLASIEGSENWRWAVPSAFTATFSFVLPIIEATGGFKFIPKMKLAGGYTGLRLKVEALVEGAEILGCVGKDSDQATLIICLGSQMQSYLIRHPDVLADLIQKAAAAAGQDLATSTIDGVLNNAIPVLKLVSLASTVGDLFVTGYAIGASELRQEFDLSYNGLLGAEFIAIAGGDEQHGVFSQVLSEPLRVRVTDSSGQPVPSAWVAWGPREGGGGAEPGVSETDAEGIATSEWTLGPDKEQQALLATLAGTGTGVEFTATASDPTQPPEPEVTLFSVGSDEVAPGDPVRVDLISRNDGAGPAVEGGITVSFPELDGSSDDDLITTLGCSDSGLEVLRPRGSTIHDRNGNPFTAEYLMVECVWEEWAPDEERILSLVVTPANAGSFAIQARSAMQDDEGQWYNDAAPGTSSAVDQQDWPVGVRTVTVGRPPPEPEVTLFSVGSDEVAPGDPVRVDLISRNDGAGPAVEGGITVSFPELDGSSDDDLITTLGCSDSGLEVLRPRGSTIHDRNGNPFTAEYLMVECVWEEWAPDEERILSLVVTPANAGSFAIQARSAMQDDEGQWYNDAAPGTSSAVDQQDWPVGVRTVTVVRPPPEPEVIFTEGFEGAFPGSWFVGNNNSNTVAKWGDNSAKAYTGSWSAFSADNGSNSRTVYDNNLNTYMQRRNISLAGYSTATLSFKYWMNTEVSYDFFEVNVRNQSGNWSNLLTISGSSAGWQTKMLNMNSYVGQTGLIISFDFVSDGSVVPSGAAGVWVDDVELTAN